MNSRNLFGYFHDVEQAQKAANQLNKHGYSKVSVDRISPDLGGNPDDRDAEVHGILRRPANSLATITLGSPDTLDDDERILASTHVDASGMSGGSPFSHTEDVCVTVVTDEEGYELAQKILKEFGAR